MNRLPLTPYPTPHGSRANWSEEISPTTSIGSSLWPSPPRNLLQELRNVLDPNAMPNSPDQRPPTPMSRRMTPTLLEQDLNLEPNPFDATARPTGNNVGRELSLEMSWASPRMYVYNVIEQFAQLQAIMTSLLQWNGSASYIGVDLVPASQDVHGTRREWMLILRIPEQSFGMVTRLNNMLYAMNLEEESMLPTYSDGLIVTLFVWKSRVAANLWLPRSYGSLRMSIQEDGILR